MKQKSKYEHHGEILRAYMESCKISISEFAEFIGQERSTISRKLKMEVFPKIFIYLIDRVTALNITDFIGGWTEGDVHVEYGSFDIPERINQGSIIDNRNYYFQAFNKYSFETANIESTLKSAREHVFMYDHLNEIHIGDQLNNHSFRTYAESCANMLQEIAMDQPELTYTRVLVLPQDFQKTDPVILKLTEETGDSTEFINMFSIMRLISITDFEHILKSFEVYQDRFSLCSLFSPHDENSYTLIDNHSIMLKTFSSQYHSSDVVPSVLHTYSVPENKYQHGQMQALISYYQEKAKEIRVGLASGYDEIDGIDLKRFVLFFQWYQESVLKAHNIIHKQLNDIVYLENAKEYQRVDQLFNAFGTQISFTKAKAEILKKYYPKLKYV